MMIQCMSNRFIVRALQGKLRIGTAQQTVLVSLSHAILSCQEQQISLKNQDILLPSFKTVISIIQKDSEIILNEIKVVQDVESIDLIKNNSAVVSINETESLESSLLNITDKETPEAIKLRFYFLYLYMNTNKTSSSSSLEKLFTYATPALQKETRSLLAEIAVKRAFSECPNISMLVLNLLSEPIYKLHRRCCLTVGVPVAPMLAKPTKQIGEVLKRLSGLAFTVLYIIDVL